MSIPSFPGNLDNYKVYGYSGLSTLDRFFHRTGLNAFMFGSEAVRTAGAMLQTPFATANAFYQNGTGFAELGGGLGSIGGGILSTTAAGLWAIDAARKVGGTEVYRGAGGGMYAAMKGGGGIPVHSRAAMSMMDKDTFNSFKKAKGTTAGIYKNGMFIRNMKFLTAAALISTAFAAPVLEAAGRTVGGMMDKIMLEHKNRGRYTYDTRYFAGQAKYDNGYYDQYGQVSQGTDTRVFDAMHNYQSKMMSVARIYHSR